MKVLSEKDALAQLKTLKDKFSASLRRDYEYRAQSCSTCSTPGACCLDEHFVNVHISKLEAAAIRNVVNKLSTISREAVLTRVTISIEQYGLSATDTSSTSFACPLYVKGTGCLVHSTSKPLACIQHACYENEKDIPPDDIMEKYQFSIYRLNERVYGGQEPMLPIPLAIDEINSGSS